MQKLTEVTEQEWALVKEFNQTITEEFLNQQHLSDKTLTQYRSALRIFFRFVHDQCMNKPIYELKARDALKYQNFLMARGLSSSAVKLKRSVVSSLCGFVELYYGEDYPLFRNIYNKQIPNPPKALKNEKKPLTEEELQLLIKTLEEREEWQMLAYIQFSYSTGARREEVRQLLKEVVDYSKVKGKPYYLTHTIRCKGRSKQGKQRKLVFDDQAMDAIKKWIAVRGEDECPYVFVKKTQEGKVNQVNPTTFNYWCSEIFTAIVGRRVHPHQLRSTRATHLVLSGKNIESAQALLGHESSETTKIYVIKETDDELDDAFS
ncbi:tyrosine-type recombinase/integrase [Brevibacillus brevis]|uniref:tyrosine-type recombinase/integrase n=1 Tax=Brevibacillus brevis TaxID=1393 RepID=UPI0007D8B2D1|nr:tyrosine-type recombinase/integrase [Brevibacillus brevis]